MGWSSTKTNQKNGHSTKKNGMVGDVSVLKLTKSVWHLGTYTLTYLLGNQDNFRATCVTGFKIFSHRPWVLKWGSIYSLVYPWQNSGSSGKF